MSELFALTDQCRRLNVRNKQINFLVTFLHFFVLYFFPGMIKVIVQSSPPNLNTLKLILTMQFLSFIF